MNKILKNILLTGGILIFILIVANSLICYWFGNYSTLKEIDSKSNDRFDVSLFKWKAPRKSLNSYMKLVLFDRSDPQKEEEILIAYEIDSIYYEFINTDSLSVELYQFDDSVQAMIFQDTLLIDLNMKTNIKIGKSENKD